MHHFTAARWAIETSLAVGVAALALAILTARHCAAFAACAF